MGPTKDIERLNVGFEASKKIAGKSVSGTAIRLPPMRPVRMPVPPQSGACHLKPGLRHRHDGRGGRRSSDERDTDVTLESERDAGVTVARWQLRQHNPGQTRKACPNIRRIGLMSAAALAGATAAQRSRRFGDGFL